MDGRLGPQAGHGAGDGADPPLAPAHPHLGADLRLPPRPPGRRRLPPARLRVDEPAGHGPRGVLRRLGRPAAALPARDGVELLRLHRRARPRRRDRLRAVARRVHGGADLRPPGHGGHGVLGGGGARRAARRALLARSRDGPGHAQRRHGHHLPRAAGLPGGRRRPRLHGRRLPPLLRAAARARGARRRPPARPAHGRLHGGQPPPGRRRPRGLRTALVLRDQLRGGRLRARLLRRDRPGRQQGPALARRARVGRRRQHGVLGRPARGPDRPPLHPAPAVEHVPAAQRAAPARLPGRSSTDEARKAPRPRAGGPSARGDVARSGRTAGRAPPRGRRSPARSPRPAGRSAPRRRAPPW